MKINYKEKYILAILSNISYIDLNIPNTTQNFINLDLSQPDNRELFKQTIYNYYLNDNEITGPSLYGSIESSVDFFADKFLITRQIVNTGFDGFSATTFKLKIGISGTEFKSGDVFVAYRGTESTQSGDIFTDILLSLTSLFKIPHSQETQAIVYLQETIKENTNVRVCGHSLGGYLAARSYYYLDDSEGDKINNVTTFNGAGFSTVLGNPFLYKDIKHGSKVTNFFGYRGWEVTTGNINEFLDLDGNISLFQHLGKRIKLVTENPGGMGNHSMHLLVTSLGFYSILQNFLIKDERIVDSLNSDLSNEQEYVYAIEKKLMGSIAEDNDFNELFKKISFDLIKLFGISVNSTEYSSPISQILSLHETSLFTNELKIKLIDGISFSPYGNDSNEKRAIMNALVNNLAYVAIVPESYNTGIFDKANSKNDLYNMTFYSQEYLEYRVMYNNIYSYVLENKLINKLPNTFTKEILNNNLFPKIAFIDQINTTPGGESKVIYVNTTEKEYNDDQTGNIKAIYFSSHLYNYFNIFKNNALVFDTPLNDSINIFGDNSILKPSNGINHVSIGKNSKNAIIEINKEVNQVDLYNESFDYSTTLKFLNKPIEDIVIIGAVYKEPPKQNSLKFKSIYTSSSCTGIVDLVMSNYSITHKEIINLISVFPEVFNTPNGSSLKFDQDFIDNYTEATRYKFKSVGMTSYSQGSSITKEHADYVNNKVEEYKKSIGVL